MKITVLGAGVTGIASAWFLRQAGHEVTVIDRQPGAGTGHGTPGWTHACGSGAAIADIISGRVPDVDFAFTGQVRQRQPMSMGKAAAAQV